MSKSLKVSWDEVQKHLEEYFKIKNLKLMKTNGYESDSETYCYPEYIEGELK